MSYYIYEDVQIIYVHGKDCIKFLQSQVTNDLTLLNSQKNIQLNALCNRKGRVITISFIYYLATNKLLLSVPQNIANQVTQTFKKYAIFSKVIFEKIYNYKLVYTDDVNKESFLLQHNIVSSKEDIQSTVDQKNLYKDLICKKIPVIDKSNTEKFLPMEIGLDTLHAVNYQKGCFMGQEVIARMKYLGNSKKKLLSIKIKNMLSSDNKLYDFYDKKIADVVNRVYVDDQCYILAVFQPTDFINEKEIILQGKEVCAHIL